MTEQQHFGKHWLRVEADGLIFLKYHGTLTLTEAEKLAALVAETGQTPAEVYMLFDVSEATTIEPEARKYCMKWLSESKFAGAANFGGGVLARATGEMLMGALRLLHQAVIPITFVKTESEGRHWIAELRRQRASKRC